MKVFKEFSATGARAATVLVAAALPLTATALPQIPTEPGWSGFVLGGVTYIDVDSNTIVGNRITDLGDERISSINQDNTSTDDTIGALTGEVRWTLPKQNQLFFGTSAEDRVTLDSTTQFGWRKGTESAGTFQVSVLSTEALAQRVWDDPYRTQDINRRNTTDRDGNGFRFQWDRIFNTNFEVQLTARDIDVDNERSGEFACDTNVAGIAAASCVSSLERDGDRVNLAVGYLWNIGGGNHFLRPELQYTTMDADGDAKEFDSARLNLVYSYLGDTFKFIGLAGFGEQDFDNANPLYNEDQDADIAVLGATVFYKLPLESGRWQVVADAFYGDVDSDIDFHDNEAVVATVGIQYNFGALGDIKAEKQR